MFVFTVSAVLPNVYFRLLRKTTLNIFDIHIGQLRYNILIRPYFPVQIWVYTNRMFLLFLVCTVQPKGHRGMEQVFKFVGGLEVEFCASQNATPVVIKGSDGLSRGS